MDQYLVQFEFSMMYFDMIELIQLINESENEQLLDYADDLQIIIDEQTKTTKTSKNNDKLIIGDVSGSYSVNDMEDAYDKGFKDAMVKYRE